MDVSQIDDLKELKAYAYDQMALLEQTQRNLQVINQRIEQVIQAAQKPEEPGSQLANQAISGYNQAITERPLWLIPRQHSGHLPLMGP